MAIGKSKVKLNIKKLNLKIGQYKIIENGKKFHNYNEIEVAQYMKSSEIIINIEIGNGNKEFEVYTMDITKTTFNDEEFDTILAFGLYHNFQLDNLKKC